LSFSEEERGLLERYLSMLDFMDANNIALKEDVEGEIASYLLIDEDFIEWLPYPQEIPVDKCGVIGDLAGLATLTCFLPPGPWTVVCVPATGIAAACALAGVIQWVSDLF
jgi:hypothetical protein